jgi:hypothetical protein
MQKWSDLVEIIALAEPQGQFKNPDEGERPLLID